VAATTFDDRLRRAVDTLGDRLRDEITRELRMVTEELSAEAQARREAVVQSAITDVSTVIAASLPPPHESGSTSVLDAVRALDEAASLSAVLDTLVARVSADASRTQLFLVRADGLRTWRESEDLDEPLAETAIVAQAVQTKCVMSTAVSGAERHAFPLALSGDVVAVLYAEGGDAATLEILARHAARVLESLTAFKTTRALVAAAPSVAVPQAAEAPAAGTDKKDTRDTEETTARRYARLLISEIKLYHNDAVEAGQRERDLAVRLAVEIARARSLYGERVPAHVPHAADLFRDELVRTLAGGDESLLFDVSAA
jgi:hypothetical protein